MEPEIAAPTDRLTEIQGAIHRLESDLARSPDDAFGYLELGCLFAEADQREEAIQAFRQSYLHRTGGISLPQAALPVVDDQLLEAFDVAVGQAPGRSRGRTRELFEIAVQQERRAEANPMIGQIGAVILMFLMLMAVISSVTPAPAVSHGYWPSFAQQQKAWDLPPSGGGYWPTEIQKF